MRKPGKGEGWVMAKKCRRWGALLLVLAMLGGICACQSKPEAAEDVKATGSSEPAKSGGEDADKGEKIPLSVEFFVTEDNMLDIAQYIEEVLPEQYPDYEVKFEITQGDAQTVETKIRTALASGSNSVDVWWCHGGTWATPLINGNYVLKMNDYLEASGFYEDMVLQVASFVKEQENVYAIPFEPTSYWVNMYNKKAFEEAGIKEVPKTLDEFMTALEALKNAGYTPIVTGAKDQWMALDFMETLAYTVSPEDSFKAVNGELKFADSEAWRKAAEVTREMLDKGYFPENIGLMDRTEADALFATEKAAIISETSSTLTSVCQQFGENAGLMYYPMVNAADVADYGINISGGQKTNCGFMVNAATKNPDAAVDLAIGLSKLRNQYEYTVLGNVAVPFDAQKLGWELPEEPAPAIAQFAEDMKKFKYSKNFLQDIMPTSTGTTLSMEAASKFFTNPDYSVDEFLTDLDKAVAAE